MILVSLSLFNCQCKILGQLPYFAVDLLHLGEGTSPYAFLILATFILIAK